MSSNNKPTFEEVDGMEISVDTKKKEFPQLPTKEWLLVKITDVKKQLPNIAGWNPKLHWQFDFVDEAYKGRKMWYDTGLIATLDSALYSLFIEVKGLKELPDGYVIKPKDLVGLKCYIMVEQAKKNPKYQVVSSIKHCPSKDDVADVAKESSKVSASKEKEVKQQPVAASAGKGTATEELNLDDINVDDL